MNSTLFKYRRFILAAMTAIFYGFIAFFANYSEGIFLAIKAGLVQAVMSTTLVLVSAMLMEYFFKFGRQLLFKYSASFLCTGAITLSVNFISHWIMKTPNIYSTVIYTAICALPYYIVYPYILVKNSLLTIDQRA